MPNLVSVRRAERWLSSTRRMISNFSDAGYLIRGRPHRLSCFFVQAEFERLFRDDLLEIFCFVV